MPKLAKKVKGMVVTSPPTSVLITEQQLNLIVKPDIQDVRSLIDRAVTEDDWVDIIRVFKGQALRGDRKSAEFLARYRFGSPPQMVQHSGKVNAGITIVEVVRTHLDNRGDVIEGEATELINPEVGINADSV